MAPQTPTVLLTADQFLQIDFGPDLKAELDDGVIRMMTGGNRAHARMQRNLIRHLATVLRGSGCAPFGSDMGVRTHAGSVRYPDVTIVCGDPDTPDEDRALTVDPQVVIEVLSDSTARSDKCRKLDEYKALESVETIVFVDATRERLRIVQRTGPGAWSDVAHTEPVDLALSSLGLTVPHVEIFARD